MTTSLGKRKRGISDEVKMEREENMKMLKKTFNYILDWLDSDHSIEWRAIKVDEGRTEETYRNIKLQSGKLVSVVCNHCSTRVTKAAKEIFLHGCTSSTCRQRKLPYKRMRVRKQVLMNKKPNSNTSLVGDTVEIEIMKNINDIKTAENGLNIAAVRPNVNGSFDIIVQIGQSRFYGIQAKLATLIKQRDNQYEFHFKKSYPDELILVAKVGENDQWLIASCGDLRLLRTKGITETYHFNVSNSQFASHIVTGTGKMIELVLRLLQSVKVSLTRVSFLSDLSPLLAREMFGFEQLQMIFKEHSESLIRSPTAGNTVDFLLRMNCRVQFKISHVPYSKKEKVWTFQLTKKTGSFEGKQHVQPYHQNDFDWLICLSVAPHSKDARDFDALYIWYIPMSRLIERSIVCLDGKDATGVNNIALAAHGHNCKAQKPRSFFANPYFEDCCDNLVHLLKSSSLENMVIIQVKNF